MQIDYNYRFCVKASLQVMKEQREKIFQDNIKNNSTIYFGMYEKKSSALRSIYFQEYLVEWLENHWNKLLDIINRHNEYSKDQKKEIELFFAEYFSKFINECEKNNLLSKLAIPEILKVKKVMLEEMLADSEKWEENSNKLKVQNKKSKEQFNKFIEENKRIVK